MISPYYWHRYEMKVAMKLLNKLWWRLMPGTTIKVAWPVGEVIVTEDHPLWDWTIGPTRYKVESADPNDHYRPYMEHYVGKQGWDWDWCLMNNDITENRLTIKLRKGREKYATILQLKWS